MDGNDREFAAANLNGFSPHVLDIRNSQELAAVCLGGKLFVQSRGKSRQRTCGNVGAPRRNETLEITVAPLCYPASPFVGDDVSVERH